MSLSPSRDVVRRVNSNEMVVFLRKLRAIYDWDDEKIMRDIPILVSYAKEDAFFQEAIDTLLSKGIAECMKKVTTLRP